MRYLMITLALALGTGFLSAQRMSDRTAAIQIDLSQPLPEGVEWPVIEWITPTAAYTNTIERKVEIHALVDSEKSLKRLEIRVGDEEKQVQLAVRTLEVNSSSTSIEVRQEMLLPEGFRYVEIYAETIDGIVASDRRRIMIGGDAPETILSTRKDYALLFTTDKYDEFSDLVNPVTDGDSIAHLLRSRYGFEVEVVKNAGYEQIWEKIREYNEKKFGPYDQLFIFFAGHGTYDEVYKEGYYIASDSRKGDTSGNTYISHIRLARILDNNACRRILLVMDSCFGGALGEVGSVTEATSLSGGSMSEGYEVSKEAMLARKFTYKVRKYFTSGGKEYVSDGIRGKHSPFASKFIASLKSGGGEDGILTLSEIKVNMENLPQLPRFGEFGHNEVLGDFVFVSH